MVVDDSKFGAEDVGEVSQMIDGQGAGQDGVMGAAVDQPCFGGGFQVGCGFPDGAGDGQLERVDHGNLVGYS